MTNCWPQKKLKGENTIEDRTEIISILEGSGIIAMMKSKRTDWAGHV